MKPPLRIGLYIDDFVQPYWVYEIIRGIQESDIAEITLIAENALKDTRSLAQKIRGNCRHLLYALYSAIDARFNTEEPNALADRDIRPLLRDVPVVTVRPTRKFGYLDTFPDDAVASIQSYDLDVVLRFGFKIIKGAALNVARHGVWSYHHGDNRVNRGQPAAFWEVMHGKRLTGITLQVLNESLDGGTAIYRSACVTHPYSVARNENNVLWRSVPFVQRKLRDLHRDGSIEPVDSFTAYSHPLYKRPTNAQMLRLGIGLTARIMRIALKRLWHTYPYYLAYGKPGQPFYRFRAMVPPSDRFWADPFVVVEDGRRTIFFETFLYKENRGIIQMIELGPDNTWNQPVTVLDLADCHLSYPFVFKWRNAYWMIPETMARQRIELYRCTEFPHRWAFEKVMLDDVHAVDTNLIERDGKWWMFTSQNTYGTRPDEELFLYYADSPLADEWTPHPQNPIVSNGHGSRAAGALFEQDGVLYRPAQDATRRSHEYMVIQEVCQLDETTYREREVSHIHPNWRPDLIATHTLNAAPGITVIDARAAVPRLFYGLWSRKR